jgi:hypothetical protein
MDIGHGTSGSYYGAIPVSFSVYKIRTTVHKGLTTVLPMVIPVLIGFHHGKTQPWGTYGPKLHGAWNRSAPTVPPGHHGPVPVLVR